ncbi:MAG: ROK family transcriptional regulator [Anaerolineae bacterium]|nr:ROK family transcriptional regulator [Anaerolineae bacterium]
MPRVGAPQLMGQINRAIILNLLRLNGPLSRADLARATRLTIPTISRQISELMARGLVRETHMGEVPLGKPPVMLEIDHDSAYVIGLDITAVYIEVALVNLMGKVSHFERHVLDVDLGDEENILGHLTRLTRPVQDSVPPDRLLGVGVSIPGVVDIRRGEVIYSAYPNWRGEKVSVKQPLEDALGVPIALNSRMRARALGEQFYGGAQGVRDFLWIYAGSRGLGAGIVLDGQLYGGANHGAGEIGHMAVDGVPEQPACPFCGSTHCLSALASYQAVIARAARAAADAPGSRLAALPELTLEGICQAAEEGDAAACSVITETGQYLGRGIANLVHLLNPSRVFLGGSVSQLGPLLLTQVQQTARAGVMPPYQEFCVEPSRLGRYAPTVGAATLLFQKLFVPPK